MSNILTIVYPLNNWSQWDLIVTSTDRLATHLQESFAQAGWIQTPTIRSWSVLCQELFEKWSWSEGLGQAPMLLSESCEILLWQDWVAHDLPDLPYSAQRQLAQQALELHHWIYQYEVDLETVDALYEDEKDWFYFKKWHQKAKQYYQQKGQLIKAALPNYLCEQGVFFSGIGICLGFDKWTPAQQRWKQGCEAQGMIWQEWPEENPARIARYETEQSTDLWKQACLWAKNYLIEHPHARVQIVIFDLHRVRSSVQMIADSVFCPELAYQFPHKIERPYHLSGGECLFDVPVIQALWISIRCIEGSLLRSEALYWLKMPYWGEGYLKHDTQILAPECLHLTIEEMVAEWHRYWQVASEALLLLIQQATDQQFRTLRMWYEWLQAWISALGWPGERVVNSQEYQAIIRMKQWIQERYQQEGSLQKISWQYFLDSLETDWRNTLYQAEDTTQARLEILGHLEVSDYLADARWVCGLSEQTFPAKIQPNPFAPYGLQRAWGLPRATPEGEWAWSSHWLHRLQYTTEELIVSHARTQGGHELMASPLVQDWPFWEKPLTVEDNNTVFLEVMNETLLPFQANERAFSAQALQSQANCPFQAFVRYRLRVRSESVQKAYGPSVRGTILHACLAYLGEHYISTSEWRSWQPKKAQDFLKDQLKPWLEEDVWLYELELQFLYDMIVAYQQRLIQETPFKIRATERTVQWVYQGTVYHMRYDRLDHTDVGYCLMDYKSRMTHLPGYLMSPLPVVQMPLYGLALEPSPQEYRWVIFYQGNIMYQGIRISPQGVFLYEDEKELKSTGWHSETLMQHWRQELERYAADFQRGNCAVAPTQKAVCEYCDCRTVCRIEEAV